MTAPKIPIAPQAYDKKYLDQLSRVLSAYFKELDNPGPVRASTLNLNMSTLPTEADVADLLSGDVYVDTSASYVLKIVP